MPCFYHLSVKVISRSTGRSAVACAAYRSGDILHDERYGKLHDYVRRTGIRESGIETPANAPAWMRNRERLWNAVEKAEKRKDAQLAREFVLAFPHQLDFKQKREILQEFIQTQLTERGLVADWAIHSPNRSGDERNWHAHIMSTLRETKEDGFAAKKNRSLNATDQLIAWREAWAEIQNRAFERHQITREDGTAFRVDHRSYEDQGIDREPTIHLGVHATAMERRGLGTELGEYNRQIERSNQEIRAVRRRATHHGREGIFLHGSEPDPGVLELQLRRRRNRRRASYDR